MIHNLRKFGMESEWWEGRAADAFAWVNLVEEGVMEFMATWMGGKEQARRKIQHRKEAGKIS